MCLPENRHAALQVNYLLLVQKHQRAVNGRKDLLYRPRQSDVTVHGRGQIITGESDIDIAIRMGRFLADQAQEFLENDVGHIMAQAYGP